MDNSPDSTNQTPYEYNLEGTVYIQKPLVLVQVEQIGKALSELPLDLFGNISREDLKGEALMGTLKKLFVDGVLVTAMSAVLIPKGVSLRNRNLVDVEEHIRYGCDLKTGVKIITDFFECNAPSEIISAWKGSALSQMMTQPIPVNPETSEATVPME
jgi:hypothetical protein